MDYIRSKGTRLLSRRMAWRWARRAFRICQNEQEAADGVKEIMLDKKFGASGNHVVVEEFFDRAGSQRAVLL